MTRGARDGREQRDRSGDVPAPARGRDGTSSASRAGRAPTASASLCVDITQLRRHCSRRSSTVPDLQPARSRRRDDRTGGAAARRVTPTTGGEPSRSTCSVPTTFCARRSPARCPEDGGLVDPPHERRGIARKAVLERVQRLEGGSRAPRPLGCGRHRRHGLGRLLARSRYHRDADARASCARATFPTGTGSCACTKSVPDGRRKRSRPPILELTRREPSALNGQTFRVGRCDGPGRDRGRGVRPHAAAVPALPQPDRQRRAGDVRRARRVRAARADRDRQRNPGLRLDRAG